MEPRPCPHPLTTGKPVLLFDGICRMCSGWAIFVLRVDRDARIRLATVQSDAGQEILRALDLPTDRFETLVFIEDGTAWFESDAVVRILASLPPHWRWMRVMGVLPRSLRDGGYRLVARNRYRMFGRRICMVPTAETEARFL